MHRIDADRLAQFCRAILEGTGVGPEPAGQVADSLVAADLRGHDTHGVFRIPYYVEGFEVMDWIDPAATPTVVRETPATGVVDGRRTFGQVAGRVALELAVEKAADVGIAVVGVRDATHLGRIGEWAERAAAAGFLSTFQVGTQGGSATVAPAGSADRIWSTNPMAWGVPTFDALEFPIVLDMATSQVAHGKIRTRAAAGEPIPEGWTVAAGGEPATDAVAFEEAGEGALMPLGGLVSGYKGTGLALMSELFSATAGDGLVSGQQVPVRTQNVAAIQLVDPTVFTTRSEHEARVEALAELLRGATYDEAIPMGPGAKTGRGLLPGEPEHRYRVERLESGIPLADETVESLVELAERYGVEDEHPF